MIYILIIMKIVTATDVINSQEAKSVKKRSDMTVNFRDWHSIYYQSPYVTEQKPPRCHKKRLSP